MAAIAQSLTVAELLAELLVREEVDHVFTVPGGTAMPLLEAIAKKHSIRTVVAKDEAGAIYMADGYAWATGKPGVAVTIGGPGATNALTGLCCSFVQENPVVLVSGEVASFSMGRRAAQDGSDLSLSVAAMSRPATALSVAATNSEQAAFALEEAFRRALRQRRPVHVSLPLDVQRAPIGRAGSDCPPVYRVIRMTDRHAIERVVEPLRRPRVALLVGRGARGAEAELLDVAERLGSPVATTCSGKGLFPEKHPLSVGVFSFGSGPLARAVLTGELDTLCAVGTGLGEFATLNYSKALLTKCIVQIDRDLNVFGRNYPCLPVCGDARETLGLLLAALGGKKRKTALGWFRALQAEYSRWEDPAALHCDRTPIRPERVMNDLESALPDRACLVADIGTSCLFVAHCVRVSPPQSIYIPMAWSCMGHPLAASLGVRLGSGAPTVCVTGDGAFLSTGLELHAAVEARVDAFVWIVLSNSGHGLVRMGTEAALGKHHGVEVGTFSVPVDAAGIAEAVGAAAIRVTTPDEIRPALERAFACGRPCVVDVQVDPAAVPPMKDRIAGLHRAAIE